MEDRQGQDQDQDQQQSASYRGYDTPGEDKIITNTSEAVGSPSVTSRQRMEEPDPYIGGHVNEKPGSANPALSETLDFEEGKTSTADLLRAREEPEEELAASRGGDKYADQTTDSAASGQPYYLETQDIDPEEAIYERREFDEPSESPELDMLGLRNPNTPPTDTDRS